MKWDKNYISLLCIVLVLIFLWGVSAYDYKQTYDKAYIAGHAAAMEKIPQALLVNRPSTAAVPWGYDSKLGVDIKAREIYGGGYFVNMQPFKEAPDGN